MHEDFITVEIPSVTNVATSHSPTDPTTSIYHVTMEDGDDAEGIVILLLRSTLNLITLVLILMSYYICMSTGNRILYPVTHSNGAQRPNETSPIITSAFSTPTTPTLDQSAIDLVVNRVMGSPSPVVKTEGQMASKSKGRNNSANRTATSIGKSLTHGNFNTLNPSADLKLPAEIFASDDSASDAGIATADDINMQNALQDLVDESLLTTSKDKMLGGINIKIERPVEAQKPNKKSKKSNNKSAEHTLNLADIKTELQDDFDWNNMTLATVNNNTNVNRFQTR